MSLDTAKKVVELLLADEAKRMEFVKDPAGFLAAGGYNCTPEEIKEYTTMSRELDEKELDMISGGGNKACSNNLFDKDCAASVENWSWCSSNDSCILWDVVYREVYK